MRAPALSRAAVLALGAAASIPIAVALVQVVADRWTPVGDDGLIATRAFDVLTGNSPLLGPWSSGYSEITGEPTFHPGPLLFWLLAIPARLPWTESLVITVALVNIAAVMGIVALAHRRGGALLAFLTAVAVLVMLSSLPADTYVDIWNPSAPVLPFTLLIFVAWGLAVGEHRLLPLGVLAASFAAQCHLSYLLPAVAVLAVGIGGLVLSRRRDLLTGAARRWVIAAIAVGLVCWSFPLADQATNRPGNMLLVYRAARADSDKLGLHPGWHSLAHSVGVLPWWLRAPQAGLERPIDIGQGTNFLENGSALLILAGLVALAFAGWRRGRGDVLAASVLALATCASVGLVTASTPANSIATLSYSLRWAGPIGMWTWLALAWGALSLVRLPQPKLRPAVGAAALAVTIAVAVVVAASGELRPQSYRPMRTIADHLDEVPSKGPVRLVNSVVASGQPNAGFLALGIQSGMVYRLRRDGYEIDAPGLDPYLGPLYGNHGDGEGHVRLDVGTRPPRRTRVIARVTLTQYPDPAGGLEQTRPVSWASSVGVDP